MIKLKIVTNKFHKELELLICEVKYTVVYTCNIHVIIIEVFDIFHFISPNSGLNMGIKLFIIDYVYYKFPKVKRKYDSVYKLWKSLPTRQEWEWTHVQSHIDDVSYQQ